MITSNEVICLYFQKQPWFIHQKTYNNGTHTTSHTIHDTIINHPTFRVSRSLPYQKSVFKKPNTDLPKINFKLFQPPIQPNESTCLKLHDLHNLYQFMCHEYPGILYYHPFSMGEISTSVLTSCHLHDCPSPHRRASRGRGDQWAACQLHRGSWLEPSETWICWICGWNTHHLEVDSWRRSWKKDMFNKGNHRFSTSIFLVYSR